MLYSYCHWVFALFAMTASSPGWSAPPTSQAHDSRPVSAGERTAALGFTLRYSVDGVQRLKSCVGARVSSTQVLTAARCFSPEGNAPAELNSLIAGDGTRALARITDIKQDPDIAVIRLDFFPGDLEYKVDIAQINREPLNVGDHLRAFHARCNKNNLQPKENCIVYFLKTFSTTLEQFGQDKSTQNFFKIGQGQDEIRDGSLGSPVFNSAGAVVGLAASFQTSNSDPTKRKDAIYINLQNSKILELLKTEDAPFQISLAENSYGTFMPAGSFPRVEVGPSLDGFDVSFVLNGKPVEERDVTRMGFLQTIHRPLVEGRNTLAYTIYVSNGTPLFSSELPIYAGSRTIRLSLPEIKEPRKEATSAYLSNDLKIASYGRGLMEGNTVVFKNVPAIPTTAHVEFRAEKIYYEQALDAKVTELALKGGMETVSSGWILKGDPASVEYRKGKELKQQMEEDLKKAKNTP